MTGWKGKTHAKGYEAEPRRVRNLQLLGYDPVLEEEARERTSEMKIRSTPVPGAPAGITAPAPAAPAGAAPPPGGPAAPPPDAPAAPPPA